MIKTDDDDQDDSQQEPKDPSVAFKQLNQPPKDDMDVTKRKLVDDDDFSIIDPNHSIVTPTTHHKPINIDPLVKQTKRGQKKKKE